MPELPEVETVVRGLRKTVLGKTIRSVEEFRPGTIRANVPAADCGSITDITRRGKYILILTAKQRKFIIHLRMTGKFIYDDDGTRSSNHCRAKIFFTDDSALIFDDVRTFGTITIASSDARIPQIDALGPEPLSGDFTASYLERQSKHRRMPVKSFLLDQRVVAGLGNIYAIEILHAAGIDPRQRTDTLTGKQIQTLVRHTKKILKEAIRLNGTTITDFRRVDEKNGSFQEFLNVYQKKVCRCGNPVERIVIGGRSTYFCAACQH